MSVAATVVLWVLHRLYSIIILLSKAKRSFFLPRGLDDRRRKLPTRLALLLAVDDSQDSENVEDVLVESVERAAKWCRSVGIESLTVYDQDGRLQRRFFDLKHQLGSNHEQKSVERAEVVYPLTPPQSDCGDSRPLSPTATDLCIALDVPTFCLPGEATSERPAERGRTGVKRRRSSTLKTSEHVPKQNSVTVRLVSCNTSKNAITGIARTLVKRRRLAAATESGQEDTCVTVEMLKNTLEGPHGFPAPDLMLIHHVHPSRFPRRIELHNFPPWHLYLPEIYHTQNLISLRGWFGKVEGACRARPLQEIEFRRALDEFAGAELRFGR